MTRCVGQRSGMCPEAERGICRSRVSSGPMAEEHEAYVGVVYLTGDR
jgi:hypothetical protein